MGSTRSSSEISCSPRSRRWSSTACRSTWKDSAREWQKPSPLPAEMVGSAAEREEIAANVDQILVWLDRRGVKATFFTLGVVAEALPDVVRRIAEAGHEVGSHSQQHLRLYNLDRAAARQAIERSKRALEDATGQPVYGFRAPDFSITRQNLELLDVVRPRATPTTRRSPPSRSTTCTVWQAPCGSIHRLPNGLVEFPPATVKVGGQVVPVLGGGYFRLMPLWASRLAMAAYERSRPPVMAYTHPYELGSRRPRLAGLSPGSPVSSLCEYRPIDGALRCPDGPLCVRTGHRYSRRSRFPGHRHPSAA